MKNFHIQSFERILKTKILKATLVLSCTALDQEETFEVVQLQFDLLGSKVVSLWCYIFHPSLLFLQEEKSTLEELHNLKRYGD